MLNGTLGFKAPQRTAVEFLELGGAERRDDFLYCRYPAHPASGPDSSLADHDSGLLLFCERGCDPQIVFAELCFRGLLAAIGPGLEYRQRVP